MAVVVRPVARAKNIPVEPRHPAGEDKELAVPVILQEAEGRGVVVILGRQRALLLPMDEEANDQELIVVRRLQTLTWRGENQIADARGQGNL